MGAEEITITLHENRIPAFVESALEQLYAHICSTLRQLSIYDRIGDSTCTYVAEKCGMPVAIFLLRFEKDRVYVLNEQFEVSIEEIDRFLRYVVAAFPAVSMVFFNAIRPGPGASAYPMQRFYCSDDIVLRLPESAEEYLARLGKATRKTIQYRMNRLTRDFPTLRTEVFLNEEVNDAHVREIIALNRLRMAAKDKVSSFDADEAERIIRLAKWRGIVVLMTVDGGICGGTVCCRVGTNYFAHVIAHDPQYDSYRLGTLCAYLTICECIKRGGKEFHFLWGRYDYKYMLLGENRELFQLTIYRSYMRLLLNAPTALRIAIDGHLVQARSQLLETLKRNRDNPGAVPRLAFAALKHLRRSRLFASIF